MKESDIVDCRRLAEKFVVTRGGGNISNKLGDGGSAAVFRWETSDKVMALKVYDPKFFATEAVSAERHRLNLQRRLIGQHCQSMVDTLAVDEELDTCFVIMEFFAGSPLKDILDQVPDNAVPALIRQVVDAVVFLEKLGLVHRDIKPENILVSQDFNRLRLLDLGVIRESSTDEDRVDGTDHGAKRPFIATAQYSSPEYLFRLEPPSTDLWKALTIYQVGGVLHDLICKKPLFEKAVAADNKYALAMAVMREIPDFTDVPTSLSKWTALAARCLTKDSKRRLALVAWADFNESDKPAKDKLKRVLAAREEGADHVEDKEIQARELRNARKSRLVEIAGECKKQLIDEFSPNLRVSQISDSEHRVCLKLKLTNVEFYVVFTIECSWMVGLHEKLASMRLSAIASDEKEEQEFTGAWHSIGEINVDDINQRNMINMLVEAISNVLVKHVELFESGSISNGEDLVPLTWANMAKINQI
ncbi:MAG: serine/threonine protein kinase [Methylococcaceae bacterium]|nr:MAG: serine/threonine protein kinase [Methylococcaceae bacterium]